MKDQYAIVIYNPSGDVTRTEGPSSLHVALSRVTHCMKQNGHLYNENDLALRLRKGEQVGDQKGWRYKIISLKPVPNEMGVRLEPVLDEINAAIVRVECLTRANWHDKDQMVVARNDLRVNAEVLQELVNKVRAALDLKTVKAL